MFLTTAHGMNRRIYHIWSYNHEQHLRKNSAKIASFFPTFDRTQDRRTRALSCLTVLFDLPKPVHGELGEEHPRIAPGVFSTVLDSKASRFLALFDKLIVGRKDIGPVAGDNTVDLHVNLVLVQGALQTLVPTLRLDLTLRVDFGTPTRGRDTGIDRGFALFRYFGFLAEENNGESDASHGCMLN